MRRGLKESLADRDLKATLAHRDLKATLAHRDLKATLAHAHSRVIGPSLVTLARHTDSVIRAVSGPRAE
jgi:hypothetical protein